MKTYPLSKNLLFVLLLAGLSLVLGSCEREEGRLKPVVRIDSVFNGSPGGFSVRVHVEPGRGDDGKIIAKGVVHHPFQEPSLSNGATFQDLSSGEDFTVDVVTQTEGWVRAYVILKDGTVIYSDKAAGERREYFTYTGMNGKPAMLIQQEVNNITLQGMYMNQFIEIGANSTTDGKGNTAKIVDVSTGTAANFCDDLDVEGYTDWYLPAVDEYVHAANVLHFDPQGIASNFHWTSTETGGSSALAVSIFNQTTNIQSIGKSAFVMFTCMRND